MKYRAFTLIELLVVIGIITFLMAIVIPGLGLSRKYAQAIRCGSNIKWITLSLINYDCKNESFPYSFFYSNNMKLPPDGFAGNLIYDDAGWRWLNYISDNGKIGSKGESVFWCPSRSMEKSIFRHNVLIANYGVNQSICKSWSKDIQNEFTGSPLCSTNIETPCETLLIVDSGYATINWYHVTDSPPITLGKSMKDRSYLPGLAMNKERNLFPEQNDDAIYGRHINKSVNIGYADGHVSRQMAEDLFVEKTAEGYKNLTPLWSPRKK